ncbi:GNAT family N-acetyltransferase [Leptolyngbyaceae cyanobacterium CCMR0082]|uniref:GNAT family N-acetyltransferase n=1 Tax=Adonisia turfae CCMR0082 TaxID=2304604 RepID=A0A6M0RZC6_9CYAN|nr:GNAT family N-acetyltransferase [Adonisia turfae]MDV3349735.1 GNAT family N-acetyltransferase [Leptothoe sp. LEGE 181152]NEZ61253.1 GNAT family N-acetyltransferase [Adonisia turfae CCMR0082]
MHYRLQLASTDNLQQLLPLVEAYHEFERIHMTGKNRKQAIHGLLSDSSLGGIWLIVVDIAIAGYIALTFGYSIEFGGKDAFIDEFYIRPEFRGKGLGKQTLRQIQQEAKALDIHALHLEVAASNTRAQHLYAQTHFQARSKYMLMSAYLTETSV